MSIGELCKLAPWPRQQRPRRPEIFLTVVVHRLRATHDGTVELRPTQMFAALSNYDQHRCSRHCRTTTNTDVRTTTTPSNYDQHRMFTTTPSNYDSIVCSGQHRMFTTTPYVHGSTVELRRHRMFTTAPYVHDNTVCSRQHHMCTTALSNYDQHRCSNYDQHRCVRLREHRYLSSSTVLEY